MQDIYKNMRHLWVDSRQNDKKVHTHNPIRLN